MLGVSNFKQKRGNACKCKGVLVLPAAKARLENLPIEKTKMCPTPLRRFFEFTPAVRNVGKNGKTGELGQDRLEVRWEAVMFLFNAVNLNV